MFLFNFSSFENIDFVKWAIKNDKSLAILEGFIDIIEVYSVNLRESKIVIVEFILKLF